MNEENGNVVNTINGGCSFTLFVVFLVLKLCGVINWAWVWVFSPLWIPIAIVIVGVIIVAISNAIFRAKYKKLFEENKEKENIDDWF